MIHDLFWVDQTSFIYSAQALGFLFQHLKHLIVGVKIDSMCLYVLRLELSVLPHGKHELYKWTTSLSICTELICPVIWTKDFLTYFACALYWAAPSAYLIFYKDQQCSLTSSISISEYSNIPVLPLPTLGIYKILTRIFPMSFGKLKSWKLKETCVGDVFLYVAQQKESCHIQRTITKFEAVCARQ